MARQKKEYRNLSCKISTEAADALENMSKDTGIPKTTIVEKAVIKYEKEYRETGKV